MPRPSSRVALSGAFPGAAVRAPRRVLLGVIAAVAGLPGLRRRR